MPRAIEKANVPIGAADLLLGRTNYAHASPAERRAFWGWLAPQARKALDDQLSRGIGFDGRRLMRVCYRKQGGRGRYAGPPLTPRRGNSRTRRLLAASPGQQGVTLWWRNGWGKILGFHAQGIRRKRCRPYVAVRDVFGLAPTFLQRLQKRAASYWSGPASPAVAAQPPAASAARTIPFIAARPR